MKALLLLFSIGGFACAEITIEKFESAPARVSEISVSNNLLYAGTMKGDVVILDTGGNIVARISQRMPVRKIVPLSESLFVRETDRITVVNQSGKELWSSPDNVVSCLIERTNFRSILFARRNEVEECDFDGKSLRKVKIHGNPSGILVGPENVFVSKEDCRSL